jgi:uncharacterized membrane protein
LAFQNLTARSDSKPSGQTGRHHFVPGTESGRSVKQKEFVVLALILFLILLWVALGIIGAVIHGLIWLLIIAAILFLATLIFGGSRLGRNRVSR